MSLGLVAFTDGAARGRKPKYSASCAYVVYNNGREVAFRGKYLGNRSNNFAEYSGLIELLKWAESTNNKGMLIYTDSMLILNQVTQAWNVKHEDIKPLASLAIALYTRGNHTLKHVRGHNGILGNERADELCNSVLDEEEDK